MDKKAEKGAIESCLSEIEKFQAAMDEATQSGSASVEIDGVEVQISDPDLNGRQVSVHGEIDSAL